MKKLFREEYIWIFFGTLVLLSSVYTYFEIKRYIDDSHATQGVVVDIKSFKRKKPKSSHSGSSTHSTSKYYKPIIQFSTSDGKVIEFTAAIASNSPEFFKGKEFGVLYHKNNPRNAKVNSFHGLWSSSIFSSIFGVIGILIGFSILKFKKIKSKKIAYLKEYGIKLNTVFKGAQKSIFLKINNKKSFKITSHWIDPENSELYVFKSENILFDPTEYIDGNEIIVYLDPDNPKKYYVDISFLPAKKS